MARITSATAREMAAKSHAARRERLAREQEAAENSTHTSHTGPQDAASDPYVSKRLLRVRAQLDRLDAMMLSEQDPQRLDRLASAQLRLSEQERVMSGRPLPGSRRPAKDSARPEPHGAWLMPPQPQAVPVAVLKDATPHPMPGAELESTTTKTTPTVASKPVAVLLGAAPPATDTVPPSAVPTVPNRQPVPIAIALAACPPRPPKAVLISPRVSIPPAP